MGFELNGIRLNRFAAACAIVLAVLSSQGSQVFADPSANITDSTGNYTVGVNTNGSLYNPNTTTGFQRAGDPNNPPFDPLAPGNPRDSWGVSANGFVGYADPNYFGTANLNNVVFTSTAHTATVSDILSDGSNLLQIDQSYSFAAPNVLKIDETITNISGLPQSVAFAQC